VVERHRGIVGPYIVGVSVPERPLREADVDTDPLVTFRDWYDDALVHGALQPDAMIVATATPDGAPSARAVLLRGIDERGFCFYTNFESHKGAELAANPRAAIVFHWPEVLRQVRVRGRVEQVSADENDAYWHNRPRASRISAWASRQSAPIASRAALEDRAREVAARFEARSGHTETDDGEAGDVPRPGFWGGYRVVPEEIEFWQHRDDRLHDRLRYRRSSDGGWLLERLQP
jgi:pyridoxamine 5'-phosphate oxidase